MSVPTNRIDVPKDAPFSVPVAVWIGDHQASPTEAGALVPPEAELTGTLTGPGISSPLMVSGNLASGLSLPGLTAEGDFTLSNIRLVKGATTVLEADPKTVNIRCLGEVIISGVTSTPMTMQEIRDAGIQLGPGNYEGRRFTMALSIGSQQVNLAVPVVVPIYNGLEDPRAGGSIGRLEIQNLNNGQSFPDLAVVMADLLPEKDPFSLSRPAVSQTLQHGFKALIVIPGSIGYLHQFYKVNLVVLNALKEGSPFQITHLSTTLRLPPGADGGVGTLDDPLRLAGREGETSDATKPVRGPGADQVPGTGDPVLKAGESGLATFFVEALKEGAHQLDFDIRAQFEGGGLTEPIPLLGRAQGKVLVRNPNFNLVLVHPDVVRKGEEYTLEARLTNTSNTLANGVTVTLDRARLGSVKLVEDLNSPVDTLKPGETAIFKFRLRALRNGEIRSSYLYIEQGTIGFQLTTGLGERNIRLNPDTLLLPQTLEGRKGLPEPLREAMLRVLGQAYSIATTKGALPPGVQPIAMSAVTGTMGRDLSEQGLFFKMGIDKARVWKRLWDMFMQNPDPGFDQLVRTTEAGHQLRQAFLEAWAWADPSHALVDRLGEMAPWGEAAWAFSMAAVDGAKPGLVLDMVDAQGNRIASPDPSTSGPPTLGTPFGAWGSSGGQHFICLPAASAIGARLTLTNRGGETQSIRLATAAPVAGGTPTSNRFEFELGPGKAVLVTLGTSREGTATHLGADGSAQVAIPASGTQDLPVEPFKVLAVHRYDIDLDPFATPYGTHIMMLFNRPSMALNLPSGNEGFNAARALVDVEANVPWKKVMAPNPDTGEVPASPPAMFKAYPRVISLYMERPVGPYVTRRLTFGDGWTDGAGRALAGERTWPIACGDIPGGALVRGKVRKVNGEGLPATLTYWYQANTLPGNIDLATGLDFQIEEILTYYALVTNLQTEPDGSYQLDYVPEPVSYVIGPMLLKGATAEGTAWAQASVLGNGQLIEMDLVLEGKGTVDGYVLDAQGAVVPGATVQIIQEQPSNPLTAGTGGGTFTQSATTDANGYYRMDNLKTGVFSIRALKGLFGAATSGAISRDGEIVHQNVVLESPTGTLKARLLDTNGQAILTQTIRLGIASGLMRNSGSAARLVWPEQATPGADGWVAFSNVPAGDVGLMVPGLPLGTVTDWRGFLDPGTSQEITLKMLPPGEQAYAHFLVVDAAGNPVQGVYLSESPRAGDPSFAITDEIGVGPKRPVPAGRSFQVYAYHPAWPGSTQSESVIVQPGEDRLIRTTMPPRGALHGTVKHPDGTPVKGAYVAVPPVFDDMKKNRLAITDAKGAFILPNVQVGSPFRLAAVGPELRTAMAPMTIQVADGQDLALALTVPFVGTNQVSGVIYQPLEGAQKIPTMAQVWVDGLLPDITPAQWGNEHWGLLGREITGATSTGVEGKYTFAGLPQGTYTLHASSDLFPVEVKSGGDFADKVNDAQTRDIYLSSSFAGELKGVITKRDGQTPVPPGVRVRLIGGSIGELIVHTVEEGKYRFPKVIPEGCYKLRVEDPFSGDIAIAKVEMTKESSQAKNLRLWGKGTLTVQVQDSFGRTLPEGVVTLSHAKGGYFDCPKVPILDADDLPPLAQKLKPEMEGVLIFDDLLEGSLSVGLKNPTGLQGMASVSIPEGGGNAEVVVRLQPVGDVLGTLFRADGTLVSAGRVDAYQGGRWLGVSPTRMDGVNGRFRFQVLPTGPISLEAWDPDSRQMGKGVVNVEAGQTSEVSITTHDKGPVVITVTQEGQVVVGAAIQLAYRGGDALDFSTESTSDANGRATFYLPPGDYAATATDPLSLAVGSGSFSRTVDQGEIQTSIVLQAVRSLWVTAVPPPGAVAGFSLEGWSLRDRAMGRLVQLDAKGQGMLRDLPVGSRALTLTDLRGRQRGDFTASLTVEGGAVQTPIAPLQAVAYGNLDVTVVDAHGQPKSDVAVYSSGGTIYTDSNGLARFLGLRAGNLSTWAAGASGTVLLQNEGETVRAQLQLPPTASLHGTVFDPLGQALPYVLVSAGTLQTATDGLGQFRVSGLGLGTYAVTALSSSGRRAAASVTLTQADQDVEVRLDFPPQGSLTGTVKDPLRAVPSPIHVMVYLASGGNPVADTYTNDLGAFQFASLPAGPDLRLVGILDDGRTQVFSQVFALAPQEGATLNLDLAMPALVNVKGWTLDTLGNKIPMTVLLQDDQGRTLDKAVTTGDLFDPDHPTFFFRYLLAGHRYRLMGLQEMTSTAIAYLDYTPAGDKELEELTLQAQARRGARVQARYPDGTPTPGPGHFVITSQSVLGGRWEGGLGADGSALVQDLPEGPATVSLTGLLNQPTLAATFAIPAQSAIYEVTVPAMGLGSLTVKVQTASGRVLTGGILAAQGANTPRWTGVAQGDGTCRLDSVWIGVPLSLQATGFGLVGNAPAVTLAQHGQQLALIYPAPDQGSLSGVVRDRHGNPVAGALLSTAGRAATTDAVGAYQFPNLPLGSYTLVATVPGRVERGLGNATLGVDGQVQNLDLTLKGTGTVTVKATKADGATPLVGSAITLVNTSPWTDGRTLSAPTDINGVATFLTVLEGDVRGSGALLGSNQSATGTLQADASLALSLKALLVAVSVNPTAANVLMGHTQTFTANVTNAENRGATWSVQEGASGGSITTDGLYTAPALVGTYHVVATSSEDPAKQAVATVTVPAVTIGISPTSASVLTGYTKQFGATVANADNLAVSWSVQEGAPGGTVSATGLYAAPSAAGTYHVVATSVADATKQAIATLTVTVPPPVVVSVSPATATLLPGGVISLTSTVTGSTNTLVDWSIQEGAAGGKLQGGTYTAPATPGVYHVIAASQANPAKTAIATLTVQAVAPVSISVSPATLTLAPGAIGSLKAAVTGTTQQAVTWAVQEGDAGGSVNSAGFYTAPATVGTYHVVATSVADPTKAATALVLVSATPPALDLSGVYATNQGTLRLFQAGSSWYGQWTNGSVAMEIHGTLADQVLSGSWTAPSQADQGQFAITFSQDGATFAGSYGRGCAQLGTTWTGTRQVGQVAIYLTPASATLKTSQQLLLTALVTGSDPRVQWAADGGSVDATGLFTAPARGGVYHVTATSVADPTQQSACTLDVSSDGLLDVAGTYQTNNGTLRLYKSGSQILGDWTNVGNVQIQVKGSLVGSILSGAWTAPSAADQGQFVITFAADASTFTGTWGRNSDQLGNIWTGARQIGVTVKLLPTFVDLQTGGAFGFQALVAGSPDTSLTWSVQEAAGGSIDASGFYSAPSTPGIYHVLATSVADPTRSASAIISVTADGKLDVTGTYQTNNGTLTLYKSGNQILGDWTNASNAQIQVKGSLVGAVLSGGWTSPSTADLGQFVLSFTPDGLSFNGSWGRNADQLGNVWSGTRLPGVSLKVLPSSVVLRTGAAQAYTALVSGTSNAGITWTVQEAGGGSIDANGQYTAPAAAGTFHILATSQADTTKSASAMVVVTTDAVLEVSGTYTDNIGPRSLTLYQSGTAISGTWNSYYWGLLQVNGTLAGRVLTGTWKQTGGTSVGAFQVTFAVDGNSFAGTLGTGTSVNGYNNNWTATRQAGVSIAIIPGSATLKTNEVLSFSAQIAGSLIQGATWSTTGGSVDANGLYTAASAPGVYSVTATSTADSTKSATATVVVTKDAVLEVSGTYLDNIGPRTLTLYQAGTAISGIWNSYYWGLVQVNGTLTGRVLTGTWKQTGGTSVGAFQVTFAVDGNSYAGTLGTGTLVDGYNNNWTAARQAGVSITLTPGSATLPPNGLLAFTAMVAGSFDKGATWTTTGGAVDANGTYLAPSTPGVYLVTATATADTTKSATATVVVTTDAVLEISGTYTDNIGPRSLTLYQSGTAISGTWNSYYWGLVQVNGTLAGRVLTGTWKQTGGTSVGAFQVTFAVDGNAYAGTLGTGTSVNGYNNNWTATRQAGVTIAITPGSATLRPNGTWPFSAQVAGSFDKGATWTTTGGSIDANGTYTAPAMPGVYSVTATSTADTTKSAMAVVVVTKDAVLEISGTYTDNIGPRTLNLYQSGTTISGTWNSYYWGMVQMNGTLTGRILTGTWTQTSGTTVGAFQVTFTPDGTSFAGTLGTGTSVNGYNNSWAATRQAGVISVSVIPNTQPVIAPGDTQPFQGLVGGTFDKRVTWTASAGTITEDGRFTAPNLPGQNRYTVTATSLADSSKSGIATVLVVPGGVAFISGTYSIYTGGTLVLYQAGTQITGDQLNGYGGDWSFQGTLNGYILTGTTTRKLDGYVRNVNVMFNPEVTSFTGGWDYWSSTGWNGTRQVGLVSIKMSPLTPKIILPGEQVQYSAEVAGSLDKSMTWTSTGGTVVAGLFTAPSDSAYSTQTITVSADADPTKKLSSKVTITPTGVLFISGTYSIYTGGTLVLYQAGTQITGDQLNGYGGDWSFQGTLNGYILTGTTTRKSDGYVRNMNVAFNPEVTSFTGGWDYWSSTGWTGTRQPGLIVIKLTHPITSMSLTDSAQFTADVAGTLDKRVEFSATSGSITTDGLFTPGAPGTVTITAKSLADTTKTATAKVLITDGNPAISLVARWKFEEGSGATALDASPNALHGTLFNNPAWIEGRVGQGQALQFNGFTSYMEVPNHTKLNPQSISLAMWLFLPTDPNCGNNGNWRSLLHKGSVYGTASAYDVILEANRTISWDTGTGSSDRWWPMGVALPIGRWTHLVLTYDASTGLKQAFQDGVLMDSKAITPAPLASNTSTLIINSAASAACSAGSGHFDGALDDLRIYSRTLSPGEVTALFAPVAINPAQLSMKPGSTQAFKALRPDGQPAPITWGASGGTIGSDGFFTAPMQPGAYTVTATSSMDADKPAVATVTVRDFDAADDFNLNANPNGPWSYGWTGTLGSGFTPYVNHSLAANGLAVWESTSTPAIVFNPTPSNITSGAVTLTPDQLSMHPGSGGQYSVLRWTASEAGSMDVSATFQGDDPAPTTTDVHVLLNGVTQFDGAVNAYHVGPSYRGTLAVQSGDTIDVAVGFGNGNYYSDSTGVQVRINKVAPALTVNPSSVLLAPGASKAFTTSALGLLDPTVSWSVEEGSFGGTIAADGTYTAPGLPGVYHVVATSTANPPVSGKATVVVASTSAALWPGLKPLGLPMFASPRFFEPPLTVLARK